MNNELIVLNNVSEDDFNYLVTCTPILSNNEITVMFIDDFNDIDIEVRINMIHSYCKGIDISLIKVLLNDVNKLCESNGDTPIDLNSDVEVVEFLMETFQSWSFEFTKTIVDELMK